MSKLDNFSKVKVLVIGDVMLDKYLWGEVTRISPEAPVPVVRLKETGFIAGGAANVAANIAGLGAIARIIGIVGKDAEGEMIKETLEKSGVSSADIVTSETRRTTVKTRIIAHQQQIARLDEETCVELNAEEESAVWEVFVEAAAEVDIFIVSDYQKGVLSQSLLSRLIKYAKSAGKKIFIDPKGRDYTKYRGATLITPNKFELAEVCGSRADEAANLNGAGEKLLSELGLEAIVITRGEEGITLIEKGSEPLNLKAVGRKVYDVTGAGDTFISALAVAVAAGVDFRKASEIANAAAGLAVEEVGTTTIKINDLRRRLEGKEEV